MSMAFLTNFTSVQQQYKARSLCIRSPGRVGTCHLSQCLIHRLSSSKLQRRCDTHYGGEVTKTQKWVCLMPKPASSENKFKGWLNRNVLMGFEPTPELTAILTVYFIQGALGISRLAFAFFLKDDLHLTPTEVAALSGIVTFPWLIKPLYGFLSDSIPIYGYRRRSYLIASGIIGAAAWLSLSGPITSATGALIAATASSLSVAISDVVADSLVVERTRDGGGEAAGALQSLCWTTSSFGGLLSAYLSGLVLEHVSAKTVFGWTAVFPMMVCGMAVLIAEESVSVKWGGLGRRLGDQGRALWSAFRERRVFLPALFLFFWQSAPSTHSAMFFFNTNILHFGPEFLGRVRFTSSAAALVGLLIYRRYLREVAVKKLMFWATIVSVPLGLTQLILVTRANIALGISDQVFALTDSAVLSALGYVAFMPTLVLAAQMCPPGVEGTLFAALMSIYNASGAVSSELGALLTKLLQVSDTNFDNLWLLLVICNFSSLLPLPLLHWVDAVSSTPGTDLIQPSTQENEPRYVDNFPQVDEENGNLSLPLSEQSSEICSRSELE